MQFTLRFLLSISLLVMVLAGKVSSQISQPGTPPGFQLSDKQDIPRVTLPTVDVERLMVEDLIFDTIKDIPWRFGENIYVDLTPEKAGRWLTLENGDKLWQLEISSPGAYSLNLTFDQYHLPPGAQLYVYSTNQEYVLGAFTDYNNQEDGWFATTLLPGDQIIIEYFEPQNALFPGKLSLDMITHAYRDPWAYAKGFGDSGWCNLNVACPEAEGWEQQIRSVVMLVSGGSGFCTAALINNTEFDQRPFVLSANHCYSNPSTVVFRFNWQSETCDNPPSSPSFQSMSGATQRARNAASDFWLMELNQPVPDDYNPYYAGWNRTLETTLSEQIIGIHHPRGDIKKFSYADAGVQSSSYGGAPGSGTTHWRIVWSGGTTTEPASSGSPLFDSAGRIIGQLHGGGAACGNTLPDYYGRLGVSWNGGGTTTTRLSDWLDPNNSQVMALNGLDPFGSDIANPMSFSATASSVNAIELMWETNANDDNVVIAFSEEDTFGTPEGPLSLDQMLEGGGQILYMGSGETFVHENLFPHTEYFYQIWSYALPGPVYSGSLSASASTLCETYSTFPFFEGFNADAISSCWQQEFVVNEVAWETGVGNGDGYPYTTYEGSANAYFKVLTVPLEGSKTRLISPVFDLASYDQASLSFFYANPALLGNQDVLNVLYRSNPGEDWTVMATFNHNQFGWTNAILELPLLGSQSQIAFEGTANRGRGISIDHVEIFASWNTDMPQPINLSFTVVDDNMVTLTWENVYEDRDKQNHAGFNIYRNDALVFAGDDILQTSHTDGPLPVGDYTYFVMARYPDGSFSAPSNVVEVSIAATGNEYTLTLANTGTGNTWPEAGVYQYTAGTEVTLTAQPGNNAYLVHWLLNGAEAGNAENLVLTMDQNHEVEAVFEIETYIITLAAQPVEGAQLLEGAGTFAYGSEVVINAIPAEGFIFLHWQNETSIISTNAQTTISVTRDETYTAWFTAWEYTVEIDLDPAVGGTATGAGTYGANAEVTLVATPETGYSFSHWSTEINNEEITLSEDEAYTFVIQSDLMITAHFEISYPNLIISIDGQGTTNPLPGQYSYAYGEDVTITASPAENWKFMKWVINGEEFETTEVTLTMEEDVQATAYFQDATSVADLTFNESLKVYPVPASEQVTLNLPGQGQWNLQIISLTGQVVTSQAIGAGADRQAIVNTGLLQSGIYLLRIHNGDEQHFARIVIQRK